MREIKPLNIVYWLKILLVVVLILWLFGFLSNPFSGKGNLKADNYKVTHYFCGNSGSALVEMESRGNRENQIISGLLYLHQDCPDSKEYHVSIIEPTKECIYSFNGEVVNLWREGVGKDNLLIPEESKRIIEADTDFVLWKADAKSFYEAEMTKSTSGLSLEQRQLSYAYKDYLENGITKTTIQSMVYDMNENEFACE